MNVLIRNILRISLLFLCSIPLHSFSQSGTGCYVAAQNTLYLNTGNVNNCSFYRNYCPNDDPQGEVVAISGSSTTTCNFCYLQSSSGVIRNYAVYNCTLDDYVWVLPVILGAAGFSILRKKLIFS
ncbi:hypothetical protein DHW03_16715 [Pedobacter yonginense]|uniref:IPTL-CTERM protein sorting domain-containing protein n=1 Tax=Pedobacter yonginense TaxID=651869 RepID=A0A317EIG3_9SPHI|nr:hypothetical protein [Pedobacter yonginense]PWS26422.1 hypothetical protein DHW03_16715 [Pedobacter yonginense]